MPFFQVSRYLGLQPGHRDLWPNLFHNPYPRGLGVAQNVRYRMFLLIHFLLFLLPNQGLGAAPEGVPQRITLDHLTFPRDIPGRADQ